MSVRQRELQAERVVEFFFSPGSRYSYLAASQIPRIEADTGCQFDWRPVRGTEIRAFRGRDPFKGEPISGQYDWPYRRRDAEMWAEYYGIPFREPPNHELDLDLLARAAAAGKLLGAAESYGWALCSAAYGSQTWPIDREVCLSLAEQAGLAQGDLDRVLDDPASRELLSRTAREAYERGAFGVPTFFFAGCMYWGNDRLVLLERALHAGSG
jgi:2-hydroxychromene-2-carboxylate isomerase